MTAVLLVAVGVARGVLVLVVMRGVLATHRGAGGGFDVVGRGRAGSRQTQIGKRF